MRFAAVAFAVFPASLLAAACGGKGSSSTTSPPGNSGGEGDGTPYAALFEDGRQLRYKRVHETSMYDPEDAKANQDGQVVDRSEREATCTVKARDLGGVRTAQLACEGIEEGDELAADLLAVYVADERGVWRTQAGELPSDAASARAAIAGQPRPLLAAAPAPEEEKKEEEEGFGEIRTVARTDDGAWCVSWGSWGGDEGGSSICFAAGKGITRVSSFWAGGSTRDDWFELVP